MICQNFQTAFQQKNDSILKGEIQVNEVFGVGINSDDVIIFHWADIMVFQKHPECECHLFDIG